MPKIKLPDGSLAVVPKCVEVNGKKFRVRRGKLVEIPKEWKDRIQAEESQAQSYIQTHQDEEEALIYGSGMSILP